jgi:hypothetical protein
MKNNVFTGNTRTIFAAGDLHGDNESFLKILDIHEASGKDSMLLFLGDYADRGLYGVEIITKLNDLLEVRDDIIALKGNHELYIDGKPDFFPCDLIQEAENKYDTWGKFYHNIFEPFVSKLYIAAIMNNVLFVHGGVSSEIKSRDDLENKSNEKTLLWSDPGPEKGEHMDMRGAGVEFGADVTSAVLSSLGLKMIVRSHQPSKAAEGPCVEHNGKVITTNSCASYGVPWKKFLLKIDTESLEYEPIFIP